MNLIRDEIIYYYTLRPINRNIILTIYFTLVNNVTGYIVNSKVNNT